MEDFLNLQKLEQFGGLELLASQVVEGFITGLHKSPLHGFSVEFAEHRLYNPGESTRHIDWKLYARSGRLFTKRFEEETNLRCQIVIDNSSSMHYPKTLKKGQLNKIQYSIYCAAAIIKLLRKQRDAVGLSIFSDKLDLQTDVKSNVSHQKVLFQHLEDLLKTQETRKTFAVDALHQIAESVHRRSLIVVFSDMIDQSGAGIDELFAALQHLKHNKHEVILFHVIDRDTELSFKFDNRPYTFVDTETKEEIKVHPSRVKDAYVNEIKEFYREIKYRCAQYQIDFMKSDIKNGFESDLRSFLIKRSRLY
ncbi:MAG: DUF58 domain-containing protein [Flavobacteriales bacterium]|nr:DUF58 domain-containing protein [Flavobacteriales bacterium]